MSEPTQKPFVSVEHAPAVFAMAVLDLAQQCACLLDGDGRIVAANPGWRALVTARQALIGFAEGAQFLLACARLSGAHGSGLLTEEVEQLLAGQRDSVARKLSCRCADGHSWFAIRISALPGGGTGYIATCQDFTAQCRAERRLQRYRVNRRSTRQRTAQHALLAQFGQFALANPLLADLATRTAQVVQAGLGVDLCRVLQIGDDKRTMIHTAGRGWNPSLLRDHVFESARETANGLIIGRCESIIVDDYRRDAGLQPSPILQSQGVRSAVEVLICGSGHTYGIIGAYAYEPARFGADSASFLKNLAHTFASCIERRATEERLSHLARFDALTGLSNRNVYLDRLGHTLDEAARDKRPVGVLFVDVDHFKSINDSLGHAVGDALLVQIAGRMARTIRAGDTLGRLSGDEFAIALAHLAQADHAGVVAQKIVDELAAPFDVAGHAVHVSASIGISVSPADGLDPNVLLNNADTAMYRAKQLGRNGYQFYLPQMQVRSRERLTLVAQLRGALERDEYVLYYQPKVDLATGLISGLEALLRWQSAERGLVMPAQFVPVLEDAGLMVPVGEWVVTNVCAQISRWRRAALPVPQVSVNLSGRQLRQGGLDGAIARIVAAHEVDPRGLAFELTESTLLGDADAAIEMLQRIRARGSRLVLDDFGTGYSSLTQLKRLPFEALKIDRTFIRDVTTNAEANIVVAMINLARSLHLKVIAEGVETREQLTFLRRHGCDEVQGYHVARPMPAELMAAILREGLNWTFQDSAVRSRQIAALRA